MNIRSLLAAVLLANLAGCHKAEAPAEPAKRRVRCAAAQPMTVADVIQLTGTISALPDRDAQVAPQVPGRLLEVRVREGDVVKAGQPLARVDAGPLSDEANAARASLARTEAEVKNAEATAARVQRVFEHGIAARQEVDDAQARAAAARASRDEAQATARRAERQVGRTTVVSPLAGTVVKLFRHSGELVDGTPATPILEIADPSRLELVADTTAGDLVRARVGQRAAITVGALPGASWAGAVTAVSPAVDRSTGLGVVRVGLDLTSGARPPIGLLGTARVEIGAPRPAVGVPPAALRAGSGTEVDVVLCGKDGVAHVRALPRAGGLTAGPLVEAKGLTVGDQVVVEPAVGVNDGDQLESMP
jgi:RND family efflux transporter MFP subunit